MRRIRGWVAAWAMAAWALAGGAGAQDMDADGGLVSMRSNAVIEVSGQMDVAVWATHFSGQPVAGMSTSGSWDHANVTEYGTDTADLTLKVKPAENAWLTVTLALDDAWDGDFGQDDFLKELYFTFDNIANTGFGVKAGKMQLPYGYDKDELLVSPYLDGPGESFFHRSVNGAYGTAMDYYGANAGGGFYGEHWSFTDAAHPYNIDRVFALTGYYNLRDKLLFEFSLFQDAEGRGVSTRRRSNDDMLFKSMAAAVTWTPIENLTVKASGLVRYHDQAKADDDLYPMYAFTRGNRTPRAYGASLAADYTFQVACRALNVFAEYQAGWNWASSYYLDRAGFTVASPFYDNSRSDNIHAGVSYQLTDKLKLFAQGEWLRQKRWGADTDPGWGRWEAKDTNWRAVAAAQYELSSGIVLEAGYQREWLRRTSYATFNDDKIQRATRKFTADTVFAGLRYTF